MQHYIICNEAFILVRVYVLTEESIQIKSGIFFNIKHLYIVRD